MPEKLRAKTDELRREHILEAAIDAFASNGYRGTTIRDIATSAGVSDGTVYNTFENKEALLLAVLQRLLLTARLEGPPPDATSVSTVPDIGQMAARRWDGLTLDVLAMTRIVWSEALINRELGQRYREEFVDPLIGMATSFAFEEQHATGTMTAEDAQVAARLVVGSFFGLALLRILGDSLLESRPEAFSQPLAQLLMKGVQSKEGTHATA